MASNKLKELVENIRFYKKMTVEEIASSIGYSRVHLQKEMGKGENPDLIRLLKEKYPDVKQEVANNDTGSSGENGYKPNVSDKYIQLLEDSLKEKKDQLTELKARLDETIKMQTDFLSKVEDSIERYEHLVLAQLQNQGLKDQPTQDSTPTVLERVYTKGGKVPKKDK